MGHLPQIIRNQDYWYLSPLREEKTPSFKVNRQINVWYDHGIAKGGNLVDFGTLYFKCSIADLLCRLSNQPSDLILSFHPPSPTNNQHPAFIADEKKDTTRSKIVIVDGAI
ncbi:CHC2 zinc finger domain-containing protein [Chitinophaga sp. ARDCPP14]|uniref:CHC2 zinc finger domain-containing protein n=1 Tax=Chitinophaga sp. ARDCPP14 TaxID=3391139 RepID=UPI003F5272AB